MIIDLYMETSKNLWKIDYTFKNNSTNEIIAIANNEKDKYINIKNIILKIILKKWKGITYLLSTLYVQKENGL